MIAEPERNPYSSVAALSSGSRTDCPLRPSRHGALFLTQPRAPDGEDGKQDVRLAARPS
jgi:hypothetical protein